MRQYRYEKKGSKKKSSHVGVSIHLFNLFYYRRQSDKYTKRARPCLELYKNDNHRSEDYGWGGSGYRHQTLMEQRNAGLKIYRWKENKYRVLPCH